MCRAPDLPRTEWPAPAKLNLFLHVTGRRADGYHELQTLFQLIDLCDTITIAVRADGRIERPAGPANVAPEADLTLRAALALQRQTGTPLGAAATDISMVTRPRPFWFRIPSWMP